MTSPKYLVEPKPSPALDIPHSDVTVDVRMIDTTGTGDMQPSALMTPNINGLERLVLPIYAFLISKPGTDTHILFDLGIRKDWATGSVPRTSAMLSSENGPMKCKVEKNVQDILDDVDAHGLGISSKDIDAVVWSHHHFDHRGDITGFPNAEVVIGPGFTETYLPGYPTREDSEVLNEEVTGRTVREFGRDEYKLNLGGFPALDYFGDGSFYLLSSPGHTVGHLCGLARTTPTTFVLMGGDIAHYSGEYRPSVYLPLPSQVEIRQASKPPCFCPGAWITENLHPKQSATEAFCVPGIHFTNDMDVALQSIDKMRAFDVSDDVFICIAHDHTLVGEVDFFPKTLNDWKERKSQSGDRLKQGVTWKFVNDFDVSGGIEKS